MNDLGHSDGLPIATPLSHSPARPPRAEHPEGVFAACWVDLMAQAQVRRDVFRDLGRELDQRAATAAASFVCWLGTSMGLAFLGNARRLAGDLSDAWRRPEEIYLMAWAWANRRSSVSHRVRIVESILCREEPMQAGFDGTGPNWNAIDATKVTLDDIDAIDCVVTWLSTTPGQEFLARCEDQAAKRREFRSFLARMLARSPKDAR